MKNVKKLLFTVLVACLILPSCKPDQVDPAGKGNGKNIAGAFDDVHLMMDSICYTSDSLFFRSNDGSFFVNQCVNSDPWSPEVEPCTPGQPRWGHASITNGYSYGANDSVPMVKVEFQLAMGLLCDQYTWTFAANNTVRVDSLTGLPVVAQDWSAAPINPSRNQWEILMPVADLQRLDFDMACRISVVRLSMFGDEVPGTRTNLWLTNNNWNNANSPEASNSLFATSYAVVGCMGSTMAPPTCPPAQVSSVCSTVYTGITCPGSAWHQKNLIANTAGAGSNPGFIWSNGATTPSITVSPTTTTNYTVTVTNGTCPVNVITHTINAVNVACMVSTPGGSTTVTQPISFAGFNAGQHITNQLASQGVSSVTATGGINQAWIYNSASPSVGDLDLGTANSLYGGPGIGAGGASNNVALGNLIVIQESNNGIANDCSTGGNLYFNFASARRMVSIKLVDIEEAGGYVRLTKANGTNTTIAIPTTGNNGVVNLNLNNTANVVQVRVRLIGSGAVAGMETKVTITNPPVLTPAVRVCDVPPGNPAGAANYCVEYDDLGMYIDGVCNSKSVSGKPGSYLGLCGANPCGN